MAGNQILEKSPVPVGCAHLDADFKNCGGISALEGALEFCGSAFILGLHRGHFFILLITPGEVLEIDPSVYYLQNCGRGDLGFSNLHRSKLRKSPQGQVLLKYKANRPGANFDFPNGVPEPVRAAFLAVTRMKMLARPGRPRVPNFLPSLTKLFGAAVGQGQLRRLDMGQFASQACSLSALALFDSFFSNKVFDMNVARLEAAWPIKNDEAVVFLALGTPLSK